MTDRLFALNLFIRVARTGSFSRAGQEVGLSQPSVSRIIADMEESLGVTLFIRTTRRVILTESGSEYMRRISPVLAALEEAAAVARGTGDLRGTLHIAAPYSLATTHIFPNLTDFLEEHPALAAKVVIDEAQADLLGQGVDLGIRLGPAPDQEATVRKIGEVRRFLAAAPEYLAVRGSPTTPEDLRSHTFVCGPVACDELHLAARGKSCSVQVPSRLTVNVGEAAVRAAIAGAGIVSAAAYERHPLIERGKLVEVLKDWRLTNLDVNAVFVAGKATKPAAREFVTFLSRRLR